MKIKDNVILNLVVNIHKNGHILIKRKDSNIMTPIGTLASIKELYRGHDIEKCDSWDKLIDKL